MAAAGAGSELLDPSRIRADFEARHERQYGHYQPGGEIEIVHLGLAGIGRLNGPQSRCCMS